MVAHWKFLSTSKNVGKSSRDYNFSSIANLFVYGTPGSHVFMHFLYENAIKLK
jgi:hypothetical protein